MSRTKVSFDTLKGFCKEKFDAKKSGIANLASAMVIFDKFIVFVNEAISLVKNTSEDLDVTIWKKEFPDTKPIGISLRDNCIIFDTGASYFRFYLNFVYFDGGTVCSCDANDILKLMLIVYQNKDSFLSNIKSAAKEYALFSVDKADSAKVLFDTFEHRFKVEKKPFEVVINQLMEKGYTSSDLLWALKRSFKGVIWED